MRVSAARTRAASEDEIEQDDYEEGDAEKPKKNASHDRYLSGDAHRFEERNANAQALFPFLRRDEPTLNWGVV
jgi:hypothetical protein